MIGISQVASFIPERKRENVTRLKVHELERDFMENKIGIHAVARKEDNQRASDLCLAAWERLKAKAGNPTLESVDCICVCTQTPDYRIPHTSAILHDKIGLPTDCAVFDLSHGCAGYVYSVAAFKGFMEVIGARVGLLFTCDPYSEIVSEDDRNTDLLFGDAATVTVFSDAAVFDIGKSVYYTDGAKHAALIKRDDEPLNMDGRQIFNFVMRNVPVNIRSCLEKNEIDFGDIDRFLMHQASRYLVENLTKRLKIPQKLVPFEIAEYGNTVSSSLPILLENEIDLESAKSLLLSGFGVGLCIGSTVLRRRLYG